MREIKFRAWNQYSRKMQAVTDLNFFDEFVFLDEKPNGDYTRLPIVGTPIMQYTGLRDKNGKEIYEGDIVYIDHPAWREKCVVDFSNGSFIFRALNEPSKDVVVPGYTFMREKWEVKVIGNIYENPELLS